MQYESSSKHPLFGSSWVVVSFGPLSKGQMSQCPFASDNLCVDEISLWKQVGARTSASERDLERELMNEFD
jgi:hypothetical protein